MKLVKPFLVFLFFAVVATLLLSLLMPTRQKLERSITIQAPAALVYEQLSLLKNFNEWSVWSRQDSSATYTLSGTDGTVGARCDWTGDPGISGEGNISITALVPDQQVEQAIQFIKPGKRKARSLFTLKQSGGLTTVTWHFDIATPRPWNIFNLFYSLDKQMGKDFDSGLAELKTILEKKAGTGSRTTYEISQMNFPATRFAAVRQTVKWTDLGSFFQQHLPILYEGAVKAQLQPGTASALYYVWDEKNQQSDMAAAIPVPAGSRIDNPIINMVDIPASKAVYVNYTGAYDQLPEAYLQIRKYLADNKLTPKEPVIEQYLTGPFTEKDTARWLTKIVFLVQ